MPRAKLDDLRDAAPSVLPSLLMCDFGDLRGEITRLQQAGTRALHLDVMDGHFVPNLTYGMPIVEGLRRHTNMLLDVHLMISDPLQYAPPMVDAGADVITFHVETVQDPAEVAQQIKRLGVPVGIALNPRTPLEKLEPCLGIVDMVLVMSVDAGFGAQSFNPVAVEKIRQLRESQPELLLQVDGGINSQTIGLARQAGCDLFVVGSAIFRQDDYTAAISQLDDVIAGASQSSETSR